MVNVVLSPPPKLAFLDGNGNPAVNYKLFTYLAGSTTKTPSYRDAGGVAQNTNPVILNYRGEADVWIPPNVRYKYVLATPTDTDPPTNPIWTVDNLSESQLITLYGGVDSGVANAYVLNFTSNFTSLSDGIVIYWVPSNNNTGPSTLNVNGLGVISILTAAGNGLSANQLQAGQIAGVIYKAGVWVLVLPQAGVPYRVFKTSNTARASTTALTVDPHLVVPVGSGTFAVDALLMFNAGGAGGVQGINLGFYCTGGAGLAFNPQMLLQGSVNAATFTGKGAWNINPATSSVAIATITVSGNNDAVRFTGVVVGSATGNIGFSWAQNASNASATAMLAGSWMQVTQLS